MLMCVRTEQKAIKDIAEQNWRRNSLSRNAKRERASESERKRTGATYKWTARCGIDFAQWLIMHFIYYEPAET
jgi:hypothetical protein